MTVIITKRIYFNIMLLFLSVSVVKGQQLPDTLISYSQVVEAPGMSKEEIYIKAREWLNDTFKSSKAVIQIDDKEAGLISGKGNMDIVVTYRYMGTRSYKYESHFTCNIRIKEGKYKWEFKDFEVTYPINPDVSMGYLYSSTRCRKKWPMVSNQKIDEIYAAAKKDNEEETLKMAENLKQFIATNKSSDF